MNKFDCESVPVAKIFTLNVSQLKIIHRDSRGMGNRAVEGDGEGQRHCALNLVWYCEQNRVRHCAQNRVRHGLVWSGIVWSKL